MGSSPRLAGLPPHTGHHVGASGPAAERPLSTQWLSEERIAEARRVWSKAYGRVLTDDYNPAEFYDARNREDVRRRLATGSLRPPA